MRVNSACFAVAGFGFTYAHAFATGPSSGLTLPSNQSNALGEAISSEYIDKRLSIDITLHPPDLLCGDFSNAVLACMAKIGRPNMDWPFDRGAICKHEAIVGQLATRITMIPVASGVTHHQLLMGVYAMALSTTTNLGCSNAKVNVFWSRGTFKRKLLLYTIEVTTYRSGGLSDQLSIPYTAMNRLPDNTETHTPPIKSPPGDPVMNTTGISVSKLRRDEVLAENQTNAQNASLASGSDLLFRVELDPIHGGREGLFTEWQFVILMETMCKLALQTSSSMFRVGQFEQMSIINMNFLIEPTKYAVNLTLGDAMTVLVDVGDKLLIKKNHADFKYDVYEGSNKQACARGELYKGVGSS